MPNVCVCRNVWVMVGLEFDGYESAANHTADNTVTIVNLFDKHEDAVAAGQKWANETEDSDDDKEMQPVSFTVHQVAHLCTHP